MAFGGVVVGKKLDLGFLLLLFVIYLFFPFLLLCFEGGNKCRPRRTRKLM